MKITKRNIFLIIGILLHRLFLDICYSEVVYPLFRYQSWWANSKIFSYHFISWIVLIISIPIAIKMGNSQRVFLSHVVFLFYLLCFVPGTSLMAFIPMSPAFFILFLVYWFLFFYLAARSGIVLKIIQLSAVARTMVLFLLMLLSVFSVLYVSGRYTGFRLTFNLMDVYELRSEVKTYNMPIIFWYLLNMAKTILPVIFIFFMIHKKKLLAAAVVLVILLDFSIDGLKSTLFFFFLAVLGYWFFKGEKTIKWYAPALISVSVAGILEYKYINTFFIVGFIVRRVEFVPQMLNYKYYEYFLTHENDYMRTSFFRHFGIVSPYTANGIDHTIGAYLGKPDMGANNGLFSDAYANFGALGSFIFPFLLILWLKIMDVYATKIDEKLLFMPIVVTMYPLISTSLTTCLLTHGLMALVVCMMALNKNNTLRASTI
jgi:hypothetical protein